MDKYGQKIELFRDMRTILAELRQLGIIIAAASRLLVVVSGQCIGGHHRIYSTTCQFRSPYNMDALSIEATWQFTSNLSKEATSISY